MPKSGTVLILLEKRPLVADCLFFCLRDSFPEFRIFSVRSARQALARIPARRTALILLSGANFMEILSNSATVRKSCRSCRLILLDKRPNEGGSLAAVRCEAHGYWTQEDHFPDIVKAFRLANAEKCSVSPRARRLLKVCNNRLCRCGDDATGLATLTNRELESLILLAKHRILEPCAAEMGISTRTVENFKYRTMKKLGLRSWADLVHFASKNGLLD